MPEVWEWSILRCRYPHICHCVRNVVAVVLILFHGLVGNQLRVETSLKLSSLLKHLLLFCATSQPPVGCSRVNCRSMPSHLSIPSPEPRPLTRPLLTLQVFSRREIPAYFTDRSVTSQVAPPTRRITLMKPLGGVLCNRRVAGTAAGCCCCGRGDCAA